MAKEKKVKKNSITRFFSSVKLVDAIDKINKVRKKYKKSNVVEVNNKIKIEYETFNAYVYYNGEKYLRVLCGNNFATKTAGTLVSIAITEGTLGVIQKASPIEIIPPDEKVHKKEFFKEVEKLIIEFYPKYKERTEKESEQKWN